MAGELQPVADLLVRCLLEGRVPGDAGLRDAFLGAEGVSLAVLVEEAKLLASSGNFLRGGRGLRVSLLPLSSLEGRCIAARRPAMLSGASTTGFGWGQQSHSGAVSFYPLFDAKAGASGDGVGAAAIGCLTVRHGTEPSPKDAIRLLLLARNLSAALAPQRGAFLSQLAPLLSYEFDIAEAAAAAAEGDTSEGSPQGSEGDDTDDDGGGGEGEQQAKEQRAAAARCSGDGLDRSRDRDGGGAGVLLVPGEGTGGAETEQEAGRWRQPAPSPGGPPAAGPDSQQPSCRPRPAAAAAKGGAHNGGGQQKQPLSPAGVWGKGAGSAAAALPPPAMSPLLTFQSPQLERRWGRWRAWQLARQDCFCLVAIILTYGAFCVGRRHMVVQEPLPAMWPLGLVTLLLLLWLLLARQSYCLWRNLALAALGAALALWHVLVVGRVYPQLAASGGFLVFSALGFQLPFRLRLVLQLASFALCASLLLPRLCAALHSADSPGCRLLRGLELLLLGVALPLGGLYYWERAARLSFAGRHRHNPA